MHDIVNILFSSIVVQPLCDSLVAVTLRVHSVFRWGSIHPLQAQWWLKQGLLVRRRLSG